MAFDPITKIIDADIADSIRGLGKNQIDNHTSKARKCND